MTRQRKKFISLIIPSYMQEKTIQIDIKRIKHAMVKLKDKYTYEIIIVVDGMIDKTFENAKKMQSKNIIVVGYQNNRGKGYAIRYGMVRSKGTIIGFLDAGMDLHPRGLSNLLTYFDENNADIVIGSKRHPESKVNYPLQRRAISFFSQIFIRSLFGLNVTDTQVGMKFFRRQVIEDVLPRLLVKKFAFDIEIIVVAYNLGYRRIFEAPIELDYNFDGSIVSQHLLVSIFHTFWDSMAIYYRLKIKQYYHDKNKRKWRYDPELQYRVNL